MSKDNKKEEKDEEEEEVEEKKVQEVDDSTPTFFAEKAATWLNNPRLADVQFVVGSDKTKILAHRFVLAISSPIFESLLYPLTISKDDKPTFSSAKDSDPVEIVLKNEDPANFALLLKCIYTDQAEVTSENFKPLVELAEKYQVEKLAMLCGDFLAGDLTPENACELFEMTTSMHTDSQGIRTYICENAEAIFDGENFFKLSKTSLKSLLADDKLGMEEAALYDAILRWAKDQVTKAKKDDSDTDALKAAVSELLPFIRFPVMTITELSSRATLLDQTTLLSLYSYAGITDEAARKKLNVTFPTKPRAGGFLTKDSKILDRKYKKEILRLFENKKVKFGLIYRGSKDGFDASAFHRCVDGKGPAIVFIKSGGGSYIFGGFNSQGWDSSCNYVSSGCWLFSLENPSHTPMKFLQNSTSGCYNYSSYGPTFGGGYDLYIASSMQSTSNYSNPSSFTTVASGYSGYFSQSTLAGSYNFTVEELEVFTVKFDSK